MTFTPSATAVGGSLVGSALLGLLPLALFFVLLGVFKMKTHWCSLICLVAAILVAVFGFKMPVGLSIMSGLQGAAFGLIPILYIVIMAVWLYNLTEASGRSEDVRAVFSTVGKGDMRVQALLIGFCFCGLLEGLAGFGAPVAIATAMLFALGAPPIRAAVAVMVGNALSVGFGAIAIPMTTVAAQGGQDPTLVGGTAGRIAPILVVFVPFLMLAILDGRRGLKQTWPAALTAGVTMALFQFIGSNFISYELTAVIASLLSFAAVVVLMRFWTPTAAEGMSTQTPAEKLSGGRVTLGLLPYWLVVIVFGIAKLGGAIPDWLSSTDIKIHWPGLYGQLLDATGKVNEQAVFNFSWLSSPGTMLLITGLIVSLVYGLASSGGRYPFSFGRGISTLGHTIVNLRLTILTIMAIMALAYVMNFSGQTMAIGTWMAGAGATFAFLSPILGWIGTAVTGSATSTGALFGGMQYAAANTLHIDPNLLLAVNEVGGGIGKIVSPQNLAIAASAIDKPGSEPELLKKAAPWSVGLVVVLGLITLLASQGALSFVIAG
ncbi:L-lactate permease [Neoactinobaculum massilliense]|uniref:L-lactate permease n=1 Tax=Neoactinobaculum massilliense TaxID=2364794 RepID=UPI000F525C63|nr:L-lactate permease [Neoactinobaculum massilliense]